MRGTDPDPWTVNKNQQTRAVISPNKANIWAISTQTGDHYVHYDINYLVS